MSGTNSKLSGKATFSVKLESITMKNVEGELSATGFEVTFDLSNEVDQEASRVIAKMIQDGLNMLDAYLKEQREEKVRTKAEIDGITRPLTV